PDDHYHVSDDEDDATDDRGSGAAKDDGADAGDDGLHIFQAFERVEPVHVHQQFGRHGPAILFEPHRSAAEQVKVQKEGRMSEGRRSSGRGFAARTPAGGRRPREYPQGEARLDTERAASELKRFLDIAMREMQFEMQYEIQVSKGGDAGESEV